MRTFLSSQHLQAGALPLPGLDEQAWRTATPALDSHAPPKRDGERHPVRDRKFGRDEQGAAVAESLTDVIVERQSVVRTQALEHLFRAGHIRTAQACGKVVVAGS